MTKLVFIKSSTYDLNIDSIIIDIVDEHDNLVANVDLYEDRYNNKTVTVREHVNVSENTAFSSAYVLAAFAIQKLHELTTEETEVPLAIDIQEKIEITQ